MSDIAAGPRGQLSIASCHPGSGVHYGDARKGHKKVLWGLEDESLASQVGVTKGCGLTCVHCMRVSNLTLLSSLV